jgi:hypothetical protein
MKLSRNLLVFLFGLAACSSGASSGVPAPPSSNAPWSKAPLQRADVPAVYQEQWNRAPNRTTCALLAISDLGEGKGAVPRAATFSGGWGVAYDTPQSRSAFGIAGTSVLASDSTYSEWPASRQWTDGSNAGYGPEGGTGPNQLAYLRVTGEGCLYNVWSRLGRSHLEHLLESLRRVTQ